MVQAAVGGVVAQLGAQALKQTGAEVGKLQASLISNLFGESITELGHKKRPLVISVVNNTSGPLRATGQWFDSGKMFSSSASRIDAGGVGVFNLANVDGGFMTGVSGELYFESANLHYVVACSNPWWGCVKFRVVARSERPAQQAVWNDTHGCQTETTDTHAVHGGIEPSKQMHMFVVTIFDEAGTEEERWHREQESQRRDRARLCDCGGNLWDRGGTGFFKSIGAAFLGPIPCRRCGAQIVKNERFKLCPDPTCQAMICIPCTE